MQELSLQVFVRRKGRKTMHDLLIIKKKKPTQGEIPGGSTRPEELFTVFTGIILTAEISAFRIVYIDKRRGLEIFRPQNMLFLQGGEGGREWTF